MLKFPVNFGKIKVLNLNSFFFVFVHLYMYTCACLHVLFMGNVSS